MNTTRRCLCSHAAEWHNRAYFACSIPSCGCRAFRTLAAPAAELGDDRDLLAWLLAEAQHKSQLPCGSCHPCMNWSEETWDRAGRKPPTYDMYRIERQEAAKAFEMLERITQDLAVGSRIPRKDVLEALQFLREADAVSVPPKVTS